MMFGWVRRIFGFATLGESTLGAPTPMCPRERLEQAVDDVNYWWAKLEEEGNPDRIAPWMLWGKHRQLVLAARRVGHEEVYHSPVVPAPAYARHFEASEDAHSNAVANKRDGGMFARTKLGGAQ